MLRRGPSQICAGIPASVSIICFWFSSARPSRYQLITSNRPRPHSSKSFTIYDPPYSYNRRYSVKDTVKDECYAINHKRYFVTSFLMLASSCSFNPDLWMGGVSFELAVEFSDPKFTFFRVPPNKCQRSVAYRGGGLGGFKPPPPRISEDLGGVLDRTSKKNRRLDFLL